MKSNEYPIDQPVNQLSNFTNNHPNNSNYGSSLSRNQSNQYYVLANLSPSSSFNEDNSTNNNSQPYNLYSNIIQRNNLSRNNLVRSVNNSSNAFSGHTNVESQYQNLSGFSPIYHRTETDSSSENDHLVYGASNNYTPNNSTSSPRTLRNFNNDVVVMERKEISSDTSTKNQLNEHMDQVATMSKGDNQFASSNANVPFNWQASKPTIRERVSMLFNNWLMADVVFLVKHDSTIERIPAHQFVLGISSPVFDAMFYGPLSANKCKTRDNEMQSSSEDNNITEVSIPDIDSTALLALLKFIYTDQIVIGPDTVMTTLYAAKKYTVPTLEKACIEFLRVNLAADNAFMLLTQARLFGETQLTNQCLDVIDKNTADAMASDGFLDIDMDTLCLVLDRDTLGIREFKLFQFILRWAQYHSEKARSNIATTNSPDSPASPSPSNNASENDSSAATDADLIKRIIRPALRHIRFPLMTPEDFASIISHTRILEDKEIVDMFLYYLVKPTPPNINNACNQQQQNPFCSRRPQVPYKESPRCLMGGEQIINRYPVIEQRWGYSGTSDRIRFTVDRKIFVAGLGLYGSAQGPAEYQVIIEMIHQETGSILASNFLSFKCDGTNNIFTVRFKDPVEVLPNNNYIASATLKGPDSYYGSIGYQKVIHESAALGKVTFQFYYAAGNNNGTSVEDGQIPQIIFYM